MFKGQSCQTEKFILSDSFAEAGPIILHADFSKSAEWQI